MIIAFHEMANAGGNIDVEMLSKGIYTAMVTTVGWLSCWYHILYILQLLVSKIDKLFFNGSEEQFRIFR